MSEKIRIESKKHYDRLVVAEDMLTAKGVAKEVRAFIAKYDSPLRIEVWVSKNSMKTIDALEKKLNRIDKKAQEKYIPVKLRICKCGDCSDVRLRLSLSARWESRWDPQ